jgi:hypothetical protein
VGVAATFNTTPQKATNTGTTTAPPRGGRKGRNHHRFMNPSGM